MEKSKAVSQAMTRSKKRPNRLPKSNPKMVWGRLLSQFSQVNGFCLLACTLMLAFLKMQILKSTSMIYSDELNYGTLSLAVFLTPYYLIQLNRDYLIHFFMPKKLTLN